MRDIRGDLQERASWLDEQIQAAQVQFDKYLEQLRAEQEARLKDLRSELEAVNALLEIERRRHGASPVQAVQPQPQPQAQRPKPQAPLADFLIRKLSELGPKSKDELHRLAVQEGYFADSEGADRGVQNVLMHIVKAGHVRQLPNGDFAEVIRLRRAM